eukprot:jgi/Ulvmu1/9269/UM050_0018.1
MKRGPVVIKKKNAFQKHKSAEAERKKAQEEEEARVLAEFEATFGAKGDDAEAKPQVRKAVGIRPQLPTAMGMGAGMGMTRKVGMPQGTQPEMTSKWDARSPPVTPNPPALSQRPNELPTAKGGKRQIDLLTEKLKGERDVREDRKRVLATVGMGHLASATEPSADAHSTNMYLSNIPRTVNEDMLMEAFGRYGPLASVKIMWPRYEDSYKTHNSGFVAFMSRKHAEEAMSHLNGSMLHGSEMKLVFSKPVPIPPQPVYPPPAHLRQIRANMSAAAGKVMPRGEHSWSRGQTDEEMMHKGCGPDIMVNFPKEERIRFVIDTLVRFIMEDGTDLEQLLLEAEHSNPEFDFLRDVDSPEHMYYRWKLYSICNDDSMAGWRSEPFVMIEGSNRIYPPPLVSPAFQSETAAQRGKERERELQLSDLERERLEDMLRQLRIERSDIQTAMLFALDHANCAAEIAECLVSSLTLLETPLHLKISRLYLVSDILHNSTVPVRNASRYRQLLQTDLSAVFQSFHEALTAAKYAIKREAFKRNALRVLRVWRDWYLFSEEFLNGLQATFLMEVHAKWRSLCPDQVKDWMDLASDDMERTCKLMGVLYDAENKDLCVDRLVMQYTFTLYGVEGPPASVLEAIVAARAGTNGSAAAEAGAATPATKLDLLAAYDSDSEGEDGRKGGAPIEQDTTGTGAGADLHVDEEVQKKANQWESIEEEEELQDGKSMSQWLIEKQAKAAEHAYAAQLEAERTEREQQQQRQAAAERLRLLEVEEQRQAEAALAREREASTAALPDAPLRGEPGEWGGAPNQAPVEPDFNPTTPAGAIEARVTGVEQKRKQLRAIELRVVELQEELEEKGVDREDVDARCSELRKQLLTQVERGDAVDVPAAPDMDSHQGARAVDASERRRGRAGSRERDYGRPDKASADLDRGHADDKARSRSERSGDGGRSREVRAAGDARRSDRYRRDSGAEDQSVGSGRYARGSRSGREGSGDRDPSRQRGRDRDRGRDERGRDYERGSDRERGDRDRKRPRR